MGYPLQRSNTDVGLTFTLVLDSDHITGATGKTPTVTISKNGGAFATPVGAVTEIGAGNYQVAANSIDADTLGPLLLHATASGCDPTDETFYVASYNPTSFVPVSVPASLSIYTGRSIVDGAAREIGLLGQGFRLGSNESGILLDLFARIVDDWNAEREAIFATDFLTFTFTPSLSPHTIGPTGTWAVDNRPVSIEGATVVLSSGANQVNAPQIRIHDNSTGIPAWYQSLSTPNLTTSYPTELYYDAVWPNGKLYFWPVPATAYQCQLQVRQVLATYALNTIFSMPPGYRSALTLTLAEQAVDLFARPMPQTLPARALASRARIFANNTGGGRIVTQDSGMPRGRSKRSNFNWISGFNNNGGFHR